MQKMLHLSQPAISGKLSGTVKFTANDIWKTAVIFESLQIICMGLLTCV